MLLLHQLRNRVMGLQIAAEQDRFSLQTHAVDGDETRCANEIDTDQEYTQLALHLARIDKSGDDVEGRP